MAKLEIELTEEDIRRYIVKQLNDAYGLAIAWDKLPIQVKSKHNYKSEWEEASIRVKVQINA
jgi:5-bromo-4-chloroindolyl phosphate hydrolysis protein